MWAGLTLVFGCVAAAANAGNEVDDGIAGARYYRRDCARCHGLHGRGDGPDAFVFSHAPRNLRTDFLSKYSNAELVRRVRRGTPLRLDVDPEAMRARESETDALMQHLQRLPTIEWGRVEPGQAVYAERCASCHGLYGRQPTPGRESGAGVPAPRALSDPAFQRDLTDEKVRSRAVDLHAGASGPPLTATEAAGVVAYVRLLSPGYEVYSRLCTNCHGDTGRGAAFLATIALRPKVIFDRAYFALHDSAHVRRQVWHMVDEKKPQMPHLRRTVSETAARAVIVFLKSLQN